MHENIKYGIKLDPTSERFVKYDDGPSSDPEPIDEKKKRFKRLRGWQAIHHELDNPYKTEYFIYLKPVGRPGTLNGKSGFKLTGLQLYIQNYSGNISIGFFDTSDAFTDWKKISTHSDDNDPNYPNRNKFLLRTVLEPLKGDKKDHVITNINIAEDDSFIADGDLLSFQPIMMHMDKNITKIFESQNVMASSNMIDPMFMSRFGEDVFVTEDGIKWLSMLHSDTFNSDKRLISTENFEKAVATRKNIIEKKNKSVDFSDEEEIDIEPFNLNSPKGIRNPCIPSYAVFRT